MDNQTYAAIGKLQKLIPVSAAIHQPSIHYSIQALLSSDEREQRHAQRIEMLEQQLKAAKEAVE